MNRRKKWLEAVALFLAHRFPRPQQNARGARGQWADPTARPRVIESLVEDFRPSQVDKGYQDFGPGFS